MNSDSGFADIVLHYKNREKKRMNQKVRHTLLLITFTLGVAWCSQAFGQVLKGSISGTVVDPQGAVVSGAQVKATHIETGEVRSSTSDSAGLFRFNLVPIGTYKIEISNPGFKSLIQNNVGVAAGVDTGLGSVKLTVGGTTETLEVTAAAPLVESTQAQVSNTFSGVTLRQFAGIQENEGLDRLALFVPGVANTRDLNQFSNTNGVGFSNDGLRGRFNDQEVDGQNNNDNSIGGPALFVTDPNFVQQYVIISNNYGPEYGRNAGTVVNIITPSGTNNWHGSIYGDENNSFLNALQAFQKARGLTGPPRANTEFSGGTIGGPIAKNKLFLFSGLDDQIISGSNVASSGQLTPTPLGLTQLAACPGIDPAALNALNTIGPYAIGGGNPTPIASTIQVQPITTASATCNIQFAGVSRGPYATPAHAWNWVEKADIQLGQDSITGRYIFNRNNVFDRNSSAAAGTLFNQIALSQAGLLGWTHNFGARMVNELKFGYDRLNVQFGGDQIGNPFTPSAGNLLNASTFVAIGGNSLSFGDAPNLPEGRIVNTWQGQDNWNYVVGKHTFKAGANWTYEQSPNIFLPFVNGEYAFNSWNDYLLNNTLFSAAIQGPETGFKEYDTFLYAGDDWKISQNLTLNLGLTWSYYGNPASIFNQLSTARESNPATQIWQPVDPANGNAPIPLSTRTVPKTNAYTGAFGPGIGFAYSPQWGGFMTGNGKTVIRGGYRLVYDPPFYNIFSNVATNPPYVNFPVSNLPIPAVPTGPNVRAEFQAAGLFNPGQAQIFQQGAFQIPSNLGPDMVHTWSLGIQREITRNSAIEARYVGNAARHLYQTINANPFITDLQAAFPSQVPAGLTGCSAANAVDPISIGRPNCSLGTIQEDVNSGFSNYQAAQFQFRANNMKGGLTLITNYTWSRNLDNATDVFSTANSAGLPGAGSTNPFSQNPANFLGSEYSISGLNVPNVWSIEFVEQLPFFKGQHGFMGHLLGGWSFAADYILASGQPFTAIQTRGEAEFGSLRNFPGGGDFFDANFLGNESILPSDNSRPFIGSMSAPATQVGIFAGDLCSSLFVSASRRHAGPNQAPVCQISPTQLVSLNAFNSSKAGLLPGLAAVDVTNSQVRYIINSRFSQQVFGTPFGNAARNLGTDAIQNLSNFSIFKNIKLGERAAFEFHMTMNNVFNHYNFTSIDPRVEDAGLNPVGGVGFGVPSAQNAAARTIFVGGKIIF